MYAVVEYHHNRNNPCCGETLYVLDLTPGFEDADKIAEALSEKYFPEGGYFTAEVLGKVNNEFSGLKLVISTGETVQYCSILATPVDKLDSLIDRVDEYVTPGDVDLREISLEKGAEMIRTNYLPRVGGDYLTSRGRIIPGKHWDGRWIKTNGTSNQGVVALIAKTPAARRAKRAATVALWEAQGLPADLGHKLYGSKCYHKFLIAPRIATAIRSKAAIEALREFPGVGEQAHNLWARKWETRSPTLWKSIEGLSWPKIGEMAYAISEIAS